MYKDYRYINAGENEFYRFGKKAQEKVTAYLVAKNGFYSFPVDGGNYWTLGTSTGKFGEFVKYGDTFFSVNNCGMAYAKEGTEKGEKFVAMINKMIADMKKANEERLEYLEKIHGIDEDDED